MEVEHTVITYKEIPPSDCPKGERHYEYFRKTVHRCSVLSHDVDPLCPKKINVAKTAYLQEHIDLQAMI